MKPSLILTTAIISSFILSSCSKNGLTRDYSVMNSAMVQTDSANAGADYSAWKKLVTSDEKNIALAEILSATVAKGNKALVQEIVASLNNEEIDQIIASVQKERTAIEKAYLLRGSSSANNSIYKNSIANDEVAISANSYDSESVQLQIATFSYLKSKSLGEIYASFDKAMEDSSKEVAKAMAIEIAEKNPALAQELEEAARTSKTKDEFSDKLKESKNYLAMADEMFKYSGLNTKEQLVVVATAMVGGAMFLEIKESKTFKDILIKYQELKPKIEEVKKNIDTIKMAVAVIKKNKEEASATLKDFNDGLSGVKSGIKETYDTAKAAIEGDDPVNGKKTAQFIYDKVIKGKELDKTTANPSILEAQKKINDNLKKTFDSAGKMADNLSSIINATETISKSLGIKLPKDLQKALDTASKISAGVKLASTLVSGFMSGGVLSAVGMLSSGPIGGMLGLGGGADPAVMEALGRMEAKLDLVLENQQKMMEMQIETIKMIKNLAVMIDEYHQQEMRALADLRNISIVNLEINKAALNEDIRTCEAMIDYKLKAYWGKDAYIQKSRNGSTTTAIDFGKFYSQFTGLESFRKFVKSSAENNFSKCQDAFSEAFGVDSTNESPILSVYSTTGEQDLYAFQHDKYLPLVKLLGNYNGRNGLTKKLLHLPTRQITGLDAKSLELSIPNANDSVNEFSYNLENLLSTKSLERYLSSLLILYPVFEFDKGDWDKTLPEIVSVYYNNLSADYVTLDSAESNISRGYYFMNNALDLVHSSIAQEALLSGEPIIPSLRSEIAASLFRNDSCVNATNELLQNKLKKAGYTREDKPVICSLRENKLLMRNYLNYTIQKSLSSILTLDNYKSAFDRKDVTALAMYLTNEGVDKSMIKVIDNELKIALPASDGAIVNVQLPSAESIDADVVVYSENMEKLLRMQKDTISALVKLSPSQFRSQESREKFAQLLLLKNY